MAPRPRQLAGIRVVGYDSLRRLRRVSGVEAKLAPGRRGHSQPASARSFTTQGRLFRHAGADGQRRARQARAAYAGSDHFRNELRDGSRWVRASPSRSVAKLVSEMIRSGTSFATDLDGFELRRRVRGQPDLDGEARTH